MVSENGLLFWFGFFKSNLNLQDVKIPSSYL